MKLVYMFLVLFVMFSCKEKTKEVVQVKTKSEKNELSELKADIGLPQSYADTLSLISYDFDDVDNDKKFLKIDYKKKLDSLYGVMDEELNIIDFEDHFKSDTREYLDYLKKSYANDVERAVDMWNVSYGINYREYRIDENAFKRIEQMIYKRRYEELLIYNFHLRVNLTRWWDPSTSWYRKRLKDVMPKKVMDSMYPSRKK